MGKGKRTRAQRAANAAREASFHDEFWTRAETLSAFMVKATTTPETAEALAVMRRVIWPPHLVDQAGAAEREGSVLLKRLGDMRGDPVTEVRVSPTSARSAALVLVWGRLRKCEHWLAAPWRIPAFAMLAQRVLLCTGHCAPLALNMPDDGRCDFCQTAPTGNEFYPLGLSTGGVNFMGDVCPPCAHRLGIVRDPVTT